jgi:hypothetical protein
MHEALDCTTVHLLSSEGVGKRNAGEDFSKITLEHTTEVALNLFCNLVL